MGTMYLMLTALALVPEVAAPPAPSRSLTLEEALQTARGHQPQIAQAKANTAAALARADEQRAPILPQLTGTATYLRKSINFAPQPGTLPPSATGPTGTTTDSSNYWNFGLSLTQYIWDFGQTTKRWESYKVTAQAQGATEKATELQIELGVRTAYFTARAQKDLVQVGRENLANQDRHLSQIEGFVKVGTRPEIDLAQARTDRANALVQLITAENTYEVAKAQLNQAMGIEGSTDYDIHDDSIPAVEGEERTSDELLNEAVKDRPDLIALEKQIAAQKLLVTSYKGAYGPSIGAGLGFTESGADITNLIWNWNASVNLTWPLFQGLLTYSQVKEQHANLLALEAQRDTLRLQVRVDVDQARLQVRAAKATVSASEEALVNAKEQLRLAEARYAAGVGSVIELGDAQVAKTTAAAQLVQAKYNLGSARAQLIRALGRLDR